MSAVRPHLPGLMFAAYNNKCAQVQRTESPVHGAKHPKSWPSRHTKKARVELCHNNTTYKCTGSNMHKPTIRCQHKHPDERHPAHE
jgi:hypothetical protein